MFLVTTSISKLSFDTIAFNSDFSKISCVVFILSTDVSNCICSVVALILMTALLILLLSYSMYGAFHSKRKALSFSNELKLPLNDIASYRVSLGTNAFVRGCSKLFHQKLFAGDCLLGSCCLKYDSIYL